MKRYSRLLGVVILIIALLSLLTYNTIADMGGFAGDSDYGGGGDYDWGGSDDWDSDYDWGSDDDWGSNDYDYSSSDYSDGEFGADDLVVLIIVVIIIIVSREKFFKKKKKNTNANTNRGTVPKGAEATSQSKLSPMSQFKELDPDFSEEAFKEKLANMYVEFQEHWQDKDMEPMQPYMTDAFYNQVLRQLQDLVASKQTNHVERISVLDVALRGFMQDEVNDIIIANLRTRIVDYVTDDKTGEIIRGSSSKELFMTYEWSMIRRKGVTTQIADAPSSIQCPSCGAPMNVNYSAKCEYCGTVLTNDEYDWVLSGIKGISQVSS